MAINQFKICCIDMKLTVIKPTANKSIAIKTKLLLIKPEPIGFLELTQ